MTLMYARDSRVARLAIIVVVLAAGALLMLFDANPAASQTTALVARTAEEDPGLDPAAAAWKSARPVTLQLSGQLAAYSIGGGSISTVSARALHFEDRLYVRVEWSDPSRDDTATRVQDFSDGIALEFPARSASTVPSICMGQANAGVNIWHWRADSQRPGLDPNVAYPAAVADWYPPAEEDIWYPARSLDNPVASLSNGPVQTLIAQAFGALDAAPQQDVRGEGQYENGTWAVVFSRPFAAHDASQAEFRLDGVTDMAVAVWNGAEGDRNGQKSTSQFITLEVSPGVTGVDAGADSTTWIIVAVVLFLLFAVLGVSLASYGYQSGRTS